MTIWALRSRAPILAFVAKLWGESLKFKMSNVKIRICSNCFKKTYHILGEAFVHQLGAFFDANIAYFHNASLHFTGKNPPVLSAAPAEAVLCRLLIRVVAIPLFVRATTAAFVTAITARTFTAT